MKTDEKILKALEALQAGQKALHADVATIKDVQQKQGKRLEALEAGQENLQTQVTALQAGQETLNLKIEAVHTYQKKAHDEIMEHLIESNEIAGRDQKILEKRVSRIENHLGLPPLK